MQGFLPRYIGRKHLTEPIEGIQFIASSRGTSPGFTSASATSISCAAGSTSHILEFCLSGLKVLLSYKQNTIPACLSDIPYRHFSIFALKSVSMSYSGNIRKIGVIGAGVMGNGIAQVAAAAGYEVILNDLSQEALDKAVKQIQSFLEKSVEKGKLSQEECAAILSRISLTTDIKMVQADLIVEAILENLSIKQDLIAQLEAVNGTETILATNTSTIPITRIAAKAQRPQNIVGMHFFNPAPLMKLVEVIAGEMTHPEVAEAIFEVAVKMGKKPVHVKDEPGFIVNRVARPYYLEALKIYEEKVADFTEIDALMEATGFKMGPFRLMDLIGVETNHEVTKSLYEAFFNETRFRPSRVQQKKVDARQFGRKNGRGFYVYETK